MVLFTFSKKSFSQNYISTNTAPTAGNICHTGGNLGIGTTSPQTLLHLRIDHNISALFPTMRLENIYPRSEYINYWDIINNGNLVFKDSQDGGNPITRMIIDSDGRLIIGTESIQPSAILQIDATDKGILIPRLNQFYINNMVSPANGLIVYNTDTEMFNYFNGSTWQSLATTNNLSAYVTKTFLENTLEDYTTLLTLSDTLSNYSTTSAIQTMLDDYVLTTTFNNSVAGQITETDTANWNTAYRIIDTTDHGYITASSVDTLTNKSGNISMWTNDAGYITSANLSEQLWIPTQNGIAYTDGNVGIGTENPQAKLQIISSNESPEIRFTDLISGMTNENIPPQLVPVHWDINQTGSNLNFNFAIENNTPQNIVTIHSETNTNGPNQILINGQISALKFIGDGSGLTNISGQFWYKDNNFYNNLTYDGDIVIGDGKLTKDGQTEFIKIRTNHQDWFIGGEEQDSGFFIGKNLAPDKTFYISNNGNVGIGVDTPHYHLEVYNGSIAITGGSSLGQEPRFQINTGVSFNHDFAQFKNVNGIQFEVLHDGTVKAKSIVIADNIYWPDNVFFPEYSLISIDSLENYVNENHHLPDVPAEQEIKQNGLNVGQIQTLQMQKIEELTLYIIDLQKQIIEQQKEIEELKKQ